MLMNIYENFKRTCLNMYNLDLALFYYAPGLAWVAAQERSEGTLSVAFEVYKVFEVYNFSQLQVFDVNFLFSEKKYLLQAKENGCFGY